MPAQYIYVHATASNVDLSARVRAYRTEASANAEEGSVAISTFIVDDEDAGLDIKGHRTWFWKESSEGSNTRTILHGFVYDKDISRGPFKIGHARQWSVNVYDLNALLGRGIMRGSDANRPAETDVARVQWLMTTGEMNLVTDSTLISTTGPIAMDANDYRNQTVLSIIDDCAQASGKNYFLWYNETPLPAKVGLFYDFAASTAYGSTVRLTNVLADVDSTRTYAVFNDETKLNRDPSRVYSSVLVPYNGGDVFVTSDAIRLNFARRDTTAPSVNVRSSAKATARALRYLADVAVEDDRLTMAYLVPLARVNQLREGQTFQVKFSHLPSYTDWTWVRAFKRTVLAISEEFYKVTLEAVPAAGAGAQSCVNVGAGLVIGDSGRQTVTPHSYSSVPSPSSYPSVVIVGGSYVNQNTAIGGAITGVNAPYTLSDSWSVAVPPGYQHTNVAVGYQALTSGAPGTFTPQWPGTPAAAWEALSISLRTSATSPIQTAHQFIIAGSVTLPATPTVGNILMMFQVTETGGLPPTPTGWTLIGSKEFIADGAGTNSVAWYYRCITAADGTTLGVGEPSYSHWSFVSEWALT